MKLDIIVNKYLLIWHLLYQSTVSDEMNKLKQKMWLNYRKEYSLVHKDKQEILGSLDNFIPDDDTVYNFIEQSPSYKKIKLETNKYRNSILEIWDQNRKKYSKEISSILKFDIKNEYKVCVIHPNLDVVETDFESKIITIGKKIITRDKDNFLTYLMYKVVKNELFKLKTEDTDILDVVTELAITNELYTRVSKESKYSMGKKELSSDWNVFKRGSLMFSDIVGIINNQGLCDECLWRDATQNKDPEAVSIGKLLDSDEMIRIY